MNKLVYKFSKSIPCVQSDEVNYLYKDGYVHVRLGFYGDKKKHIRGFEAKLAFLMTISMHNEVKSILDLDSIKEAKDKNNYQEIWKKCLECLERGAGYNNMDDLFLMELLNYKGMKILPAYSLKNPPKDAFDLLGAVSGLDVLDLKEDLPFKDLKDFLFNDSIEISIEEVKQVNHDKFIKKYKTKSVKTYELW